MKYITKSTSGAELRQKAKAMQQEIYELHTKIRKQKEMTKEVRRKWNIRYNKLKWKMYKKDQFIYMKKIHIQRLRMYIGHKMSTWRKDGYKKAVQRLNNGSLKVRKMSGFMFHMATVMEIYQLDLREYAFLMWAGKHEFFGKEDFVIANPNVDAKFYVLVKKMISKGYVNIIRDDFKIGNKLFSLTGTGLNLYTRISKFTNKYLIDSGTSDIRNNLQDS